MCHLYSSVHESLGIRQTRACSGRAIVIKDVVKALQYE